MGSHPGSPEGKGPQPIPLKGGGWVPPFIHPSVPRHPGCEGWVADAGMGCPGCGRQVSVLAPVECLRCRARPPGRAISFGARPSRERPLTSLRDACAGPVFPQEEVACD